MKKWSVAEKQDYERMKGQIEAPDSAGNRTGMKWKQFCTRWTTGGKQPVSNVRQGDKVQGLRQQGCKWEMKKCRRSEDGTEKLGWVGIPCEVC